MRVKKQWVPSFIFALVLLSAGFNVFAQEQGQSSKVITNLGNVLIYERESAGQQQEQGIRVPGKPGDDTLIFISSEMSFDGKVVKGVPYSAQSITETTRTLSDGNRITHKNTATIYRDGEGRTRREQELGVVGPWAIPGEPKQTIFINDPVAGVNYILDPRTHTARKIAPVRIDSLPSDIQSPVLGAGAKVTIGVNKEVFTATATAPGDGAQVQELRVGPDVQKGTTESLGKQTIEGVEAEGTRTTVTIPAGQVGNEQPIHIVWEKWYSPELQVVVMSKHSDPFVGETVYKLTNIVRGEPSHALFEVPGDYTIKEIPIRTR
ncbi:MAG: hypothetical protein M3362_28230, partial [Acidobacteriota bacterium]|nr:hypothetical protein [Acidobacteriota bacterium]